MRERGKKRRNEGGGGVRTGRCAKKCVSLKEKKRGLYVHVYAGKVLQKKLNKRDDTKTNKRKGKKKKKKKCEGGCWCCYM